MGSWLLCVLLLIPLCGHAVERDYYFKTLGDERGLTQNTVLAILQDRVGYVWIGTQDGLLRYDGYQFRSYRDADTDADPVLTGMITALGEDDQGRLWVGTRTAGIGYLDTQDGVFHASPPPVPDHDGPNPVRALQFDPRRGLWIGTNAGTTRMDLRDGGMHQLGDAAGVDPDKARTVRQFALSDNGDLWIISDGGLLRLGQGASVPVRVAADSLGVPTAVIVARDQRVYAGNTEGLFLIGTDNHAQRIWAGNGERPIAAITEDPRGRLWLAVRGHGLVVFDPTRNTEQWLVHDRDVPGSLPDAFVTVMRVDRSGLLWLGTAARGVATVVPTGATFRYVIDTSPARDPVAANNIRAIHQDADGMIWIGTDGNGLSRYDPRSQRFASFNTALEQALGLGKPGESLYVTGVADAGDGQLWIGTARGLVRLDPRTNVASALPIDATGRNGLSSPQVRVMIRTDDGSLWIGTNNAGLSHYDPASGRWQQFNRRNGLSNDMVLALASARDGQLWIGTLDGLNRLDPADGSLRTFRHQPRHPHSLLGNTVRSLYSAADGTLWIGTHAGLNRLDTLSATDARFSHWQTRDGLPNDTIYGILQDSAQRLWLSTNHGIVAFDISAGIFHAFSLGDGLQAMEFNGGAYAALRDGHLAFGGIKGLNLFKPEAVVASRHIAPVVITDVRIGDHVPQRPPASGGLNMTVNDAIVRFEFAALDYMAPERNQFSYRLDGFDTDWIAAGGRHDATYTNLDRGNYVFRVRASNHAGYWNPEPATLHVSIAPRWFASPIWLLLYGLVALLLLLWFLRARRARRREEQRFHDEILDREDRLRMALWGSGDEFWDWDITSKELVRIGTAHQERGTGQQRMSFEDWARDGIHPDDYAQVLQRFEDYAAGLAPVFESEHRVRNAAGDWVWILARGKIVERDADGEPLRVCGTARNITSARMADRERRIAQEITRSMMEAVAVTDFNFQFIQVNPAFTHITGWRGDEIVGRNLSILNCSQHTPEHYQDVRNALLRDGHWRGEIWQRRKDGEEFMCWLQMSEVLDASNERAQWIAVMSDITDRKRAEQELRYLANYDTLTGLPNRTLLSDRLGRAMAHARRNEGKAGLLFLDLDRFKHVNDSMGHAVGDLMLKAAGNRLRHVVRESDTVARLGGDEFTVVLEDIGDASEAERVAQKLLTAFARPLELDNGQEVVISPSIGISLYPDHGQVPADLIKCADTAMYQAKERGRNTYMLYTESMDASARLRANMISALRRAIENNEFSLVYQPKLSLFDERITGVEALLRWHNQELGNVPPMQFIPIAEETGLIIQIGDWVLAQACAQLGRWHAAGVRDIVMSINVSVLQLLRGELTQRLCEVLAEHDVAPNQIELELTESMVMANAEQSISTLRQIKALGVCVAIDDFGTGYSSLAYLKRLPIDSLKIDKEFVGDITTDPDDEAITATVINMAHSLGLNVIAEGVETAEQVEYLREQGCDEIQGHWLARPMPADACLVFLREHTSTRRASLNALR